MLSKKSKIKMLRVAKSHGAKGLKSTAEFGRKRLVIF